MPVVTCPTCGQQWRLDPARPVSDRHCPFCRSPGPSLVQQALVAGAALALVVGAAVLWGRAYPPTYLRGLSP